MKCRNVEGLLIAYLDGEVTPAERTEIEAHLAGCPACAGELATLRAVRNQVGATLQAMAAAAVPSPQAWARLQKRLTPQPRPSWAQRLVSWLFPARPLWRSALAGALALVVLLAGTVAVYPPARAIANEGFVFAWRVIRTATGYEVVKAPAEVTSEALLDPRVSPDGQLDFKAIQVTPVPAMTLEEAQARVDFPIRLPTYLPDGYQQSAIYAASDKGEARAQILFARAGHVVLSLYETRDPGFLQGGDAVREVQLRGRTAYFAEYPVTYVADPEALPTVSVGHSLAWEEDGVVYQLRSDTGLPLEEMLKIAESLQ